jgi:uncharacterized caspase-like protein
MPRPSLLTAATFLVATAIFAAASPAFSADRVALVIGNGLYQKVAALPNPTRDADDISRALERLNFRVTRLSNADAADMRKAVINFGRAAEGSEMAVVYYAGHGMEAGGENWLIPVDAELRADTDVEIEAISLRSVTLQVSKAQQLGLVILDACRDNPFAAKMQRSLRTRAVTRGLAPTEPTDNVLVAYAARDGTTANDGEGKNSPFTAALLHNIETPGLEISFLFRNVRDEVMAATKREQQPFVYGSLSKEAIYLKPLALHSLQQGSADEATSSKENEQWQAIKTSSVPGLYEEFLTKYPNSPHAFEARERLTDLKSKQVASLNPATTASPNTTVEKPELLQGTQGDVVGGEKRSLLTPKDAERVATMARELQLKMPKFKIEPTNGDVPDSYRRFVGIWSNRIGWGNGKGRHAMLIVTDVTSDGLANGYYAWGPPTELSFNKAAAGSVSFAERISNGALSFKAGSRTTVEAQLNNEVSMTLRAVFVQDGGISKTSHINFNPLWQPIPPETTLKGKRVVNTGDGSPAAHPTK